MQRKTYKSSTFVKYDKVNGRSYKTVRSQPNVGPAPSVSLYDGQPKEFIADELAPESLQPSADNTDMYSESAVQESLDNDSMSASEAGFMQGNMSA